MKKVISVLALLALVSTISAQIRWLPSEELEVYDLKDGSTVTSRCMAYAECDSLAEVLRITGAIDLNDYYEATLEDPTIRDPVKYRVLYYWSEESRGSIIIYEHFYGDSIYKVYYIKRR